MQSAEAAAGRVLRYATHYGLSGGPMMQMSQMNGFDSSRSPAEKPSTGLFFRPARGRRHRRFRVGVAAVGAAVASGARDGGGGGRARAFQLLHQHDGALAAVRGRGARARLAVCAAGCLARGGHGAGREECAPRPSPVARRRGRRLGRARTRAVSAESGTLRPAGASSRASGDRGTARGALGSPASRPPFSSSSSLILFQCMWL